MIDATGSVAIYGSCGEAVRLGVRPARAVASWLRGTLRPWCLVYCMRCWRRRRRPQRTRPAGPSRRFDGYAVRRGEDEEIARRMGEVAVTAALEEINGTRSLRADARQMGFVFPGPETGRGAGGVSVLASRPGAARKGVVLHGLAMGMGVRLVPPHRCISNFRGGTSDGDRRCLSVGHGARGGRGFMRDPT